MEKYIRKQKRVFQHGTVGKFFKKTRGGKYG